MGERNGQFTLLACGQIEDNKEERGPPERQCVLNMCIHEEGEGGGPSTHKCALPARSQVMEGDNPTRQRASPAFIQGTDEGGAPPDQKRAPLAHGLQEREGGHPPNRKRIGCHPPSSNTRYSHRAHGRERGGDPPTQIG